MFHFSLACTSLCAMFKLIANCTGYLWIIMNIAPSVFFNWKQLWIILSLLLQMQYQVMQLFSHKFGYIHYKIPVSSCRVSSHSVFFIYACALMLTFLCLDNQVLAFGRMLHQFSYDYLSFWTFLLYWISPFIELSRKALWLWCRWVRARQSP